MFFTHAPNGRPSRRRAAALVSLLGIGCSSSQASDPRAGGAGGGQAGSTNGVATTSGVATGASGAGIAPIEAGPIGAGAGGGDASGPPPGVSCSDICLAPGTCVGGVCVVVDNPGQIDDAGQTRLKGGGSADPAFRWLYPYDKTVFARGLLPPTLQFAGAATDAVYVHITSIGLDYQGFFGRSNPARVTFSAPIWAAITWATKLSPTLKVDVIKLSAGGVTGPITESWTVAQGSLRGTVYYETVTGGRGDVGGSVSIMQLRPGQMAPTVLKAGCANSCHTASADGSTLIAAGPTLGQSRAYDLRNNAQPIGTRSDQALAYGALYPDGKFLMSATSYRTWSAYGSLPSRLYDTRTGQNIAAPGWDGVITKAGIPAFSPDGSKITFNYRELGLAGTASTIAVMDFDVASKRFSNLSEVASDTTSFVGWPTFTPDTKSVIFHAGTSEAFETGFNEMLNGYNQGDLFIVDLASRTKVRLDAGGGYLPGGGTYLPANDPGMALVPTVLPLAVGGYFWVMFTSHRSYGNLLESKSPNGKLWVSAVDIDAPAGRDPSHPAFCLDGQDLQANNLRGFWVLDPCRPTGTSCTSGDQCCQGFCRPFDGGMACVTPPNACSNEFEKCATAADCCDKAQICVNARCALPPPPR